VLRDYPESKKLKALRSYFNSESPSRTGTPVGRRRREWVEGNDTPDEHEEWSTWDENWDRVMHRGVFRR
jgi:beta-1,4-mannosyltransferase